MAAASEGLVWKRTHLYSSATPNVVYRDTPLSRRPTHSIVRGDPLTLTVSQVVHATG